MLLSKIYYYLITSDIFCVPRSGCYIIQAVKMTALKKTILKDSYLCSLVNRLFTSVVLSCVK